MAKHGKSYPTEEEYQMRLEIFVKNIKFIEEHDPEVEGHTVALNEMSDWTDEEFGVVSGRFNVAAHKERIGLLGASEGVLLEGDVQGLPEAVDWRHHNGIIYVTTAR